MTPEQIQLIKSTLDTLEDGFQKKVLSFFREEVLNELKHVIPLILERGEVEKNWIMPGKEYYISIFKRFLRELFVQGMFLGFKEVQKLKAKNRKKISMAVSLEATSDPVIPTGAIKWLDGWADEFGSDYYGDVTSDVADVLKNSLKKGNTLENIMDDLERYLTGDSFNRRRLEVIARTNSTTAFNQGRVEMFKQESDFVVAVEFMAILDSRVSDICESRDGKIIMMDDTETLRANTPPLHYNCRSLLSPISKFEWEEMKGSDGFEKRVNWKDVEKENPPQKGFGEIGKKRALKKEGEGGIIDLPSAITPGLPERDLIIKQDPDLDIEENLNKLTVNAGKKPHAEVLIRQYDSNQEEIDELQSAWSEVPPGHFRRLKNVEISNSVLQYQNSQRAVNGFYGTDTRIITLTREVGELDLNKFNGNLPKTIANVSLHELGHHYYTYLFSVNNPEEYKQFNRIFGDFERNKIMYRASWYNKSEFFADLYRSYLTDGEIVKYVEDMKTPNTPSILKIFKSIFKEVA